jgi:hypothetical protein
LVFEETESETRISELTFHLPDHRRRRMPGAGTLILAVAVFASVPVGSPADVTLKLGLYIPARYAGDMVNTTDLSPSLPPRWWHTPALIGVKAVHSAAFLLIQSCIIYLLYSGIRGQSDRKAAAAAGVALAESAIYAGNGFRCPLTGLAEQLGSEHGQVTDIFLPRWLANNIANIYTPMLLVGLYFHARNLRRGPSHA